jgi:sodium/potassium-transporting ATPase subunit alpha
MGVVSISSGIIFFGLSISMGNSIIEAMVFMVGVIVSIVPEGLLPQFTLALSNAAIRMHKKKVMVKNLEIIDTLGATTAISSKSSGF